jgi:hypothetical protein
MKEHDMPQFVRRKPAPTRLTEQALDRIERTAQTRLGGTGWGQDLLALCEEIRRLRTEQGTTPRPRFQAFAETPAQKPTAASR